MNVPSTLANTCPGESTAGQPPGRRILFASVHSILDNSNGASVATLDMLHGLSTLGFECQAFCAAKLDLQTEVSFEKMIGDLHEPCQLRTSACGTDRAQVLYTRRGQVPITFIRQKSTRHVKQTPEEIRTVLRFFQKFLDIFRPDVLLTYGGDPITQGMIAVARCRLASRSSSACTTSSMLIREPFLGSISASWPPNSRAGIITRSSASTAKLCPIRSTGSGFGPKTASHAT